MLLKYSVLNTTSTLLVIFLRRRTFKDERRELLTKGKLLSVYLGGENERKMKNEVKKKQKEIFCAFNDGWRAFE
jgi:hypothetical protein